MSKKLQRYWYQQGVAAGSREGWMNLEETLAEDIERHPNLSQTAIELVQIGIEGWEETDHFQILYGSKMMDDAKGEFGELSDEAIERWQDYKDAFWEGYLAGRQKAGVDVYEIANNLIAKRTGKRTRRTTGRRKRSQGKQLSLKGIRR